jgi:cutinase
VRRLAPLCNSVGQPGKWAFQGVNYDATVDGYGCLGLPVCTVATQYIEQAATQCPNTKIIVSGYSEGAMVAHNGLGYASTSAKAQVTVSSSESDLLSQILT